jgi:hypothetical protein
MTMYLKRLSLFLLSLSVFAGTCVSSVYAQSPTSRPTPGAIREVPPAGINLTVSPTFLNLVTDPGEAIESQFRIKNNSNFTENLQIQIAKFEIVEGGKPVLSDIKPGDAFAEWVTLPEPTFSISPNQTKTVKFSLNPPESASLGYYYALVINRVQERQEEGQQAVIAGSPALLTLLEVRSPNAKREVQLVEFKTDKMWYEYLPTNFTVKVKNTGNVHIVPSGNIFIDRGNKKDIAILAANESRGNVLPQTEREFIASWSDGMIITVPSTVNGRENSETQFDFDKPLSSFRIGKYTANLLLVYDNGERDVPLEAQVSFWVIPWKLILGALLLILTPFILFILFRKVRGKRSK